MSRFEIAIEEPLNETVTLLSKDWYKGRIAGVNVKSGISEKSGKPWVNMSLRIVVHGQAVTEQLEMDEKGFFYQPNIFLDEKGRAVKDNVQLAKLQTITGIKEKLSDSSFQEAMMEGIEDSDELPEALVKYYTNLGKQMEGTDLMAFVDQQKNYRDKDLLENFISKIAALAEDEE